MGAGFCSLYRGSLYQGLSVPISTIETLFLSVKLHMDLIALLLVKHNQMDYQAKFSIFLSLIWQLLDHYN